MRIAGIIAEYNPLHLGHVHHLREARRQTGAEGIIVLLSGDFVQRGEPALTDKYRRARMALAAGADAVLELPVSCATGSAERFAAGAVSILDRLHCVTDLVYGCEEAGGDLTGRIAEVLAEEPEAYQTRLREALRSGLSFPEARCSALEPLVPGCTPVLSLPNSILAVEYRKALLRLNSRIRPLGIPRSGENYHSERIPALGFASASAIREELRHFSGPLSGVFPDPLPPEYRQLLAQLPPFTRELLDYRIFPEDLSGEMQTALCLLRPEEMRGIQDLSGEMLSRLRQVRSSLLSFPELVDAVRTKNLTRSRVSRALLHLLLRLPEPEGGIPVFPAVRLLGMREGSPALRVLMDTTEIPVVTKLADAPENWFADELRASALYRTVVWKKTGIRLPGEYQSHPVIR